MGIAALAYSRLVELAKAEGLNVLGVCSTELLSQSVGPLERWQNAGMAAGMKYMQRPAVDLCSPARLHPAALSMVVFAVPYFCRQDAGIPGDCAGIRPPGFGRIARYAWGRDYHEVLRRRLEFLTIACEKELGRAIDARAFIDAVPLSERACGVRAGLGFIGRNSMLIRPGVGSFFFLAELLWNVAVEDFPRLKGFAGCGSCRNCLESCPVSAIEDGCMVDAGKCISYLTIEKHGTLSSIERESIGEWLFGCDLCQETCAFNHKALLYESARGAPGEFSPEQGAGGLVRVEVFLRMRSQKEFAQRFGGTALARAGRAGLARNAAVVAANTKAGHAADALLEALELDASATVRRHALWALWKLCHSAGSLPKSRLDGILNKAAKDPDPGVVAEANLLSAGLQIGC